MQSLKCEGGWMIDIQKYNRTIEAKGRELRGAFKNQVISLQETPGGKGDKLRNNIRVTFKKFFGEIDRIRFPYPRHGYFFLKGVGSGYKSTGNAVVRMAKTSSGKQRTDKDWVNPILTYEQQIADIAMEHFGNKAIDIKTLKTRPHVR